MNNTKTNGEKRKADTTPPEDEPNSKRQKACEVTEEPTTLAKRLAQGEFPGLARGEFPEEFVRTAFQAFNAFGCHWNAEIPSKKINAEFQVAKTCLVDLFEAMLASKSKPEPVTRMYDLGLKAYPPLSMWYIAAVWMPTSFLKRLFDGNSPGFCHSVVFPVDDSIQDFLPFVSGMCGAFAATTLPMIVKEYAIRGALGECLE